MMMMMMMISVNKATSTKRNFSATPTTTVHHRQSVSELLFRLELTIQFNFATIKALRTCWIRWETHRQTQTCEEALKKTSIITKTPPGDKPEAAGNPTHNNSSSFLPFFLLQLGSGWSTATLEQSLWELWYLGAEIYSLYSTRPPGDFPGMNTVTPTSAIAHTYLRTYLFSLGHFLEWM